MKILVMGATGYIGGRLTPLLAGAGHEVRCLTRRPEQLAGVAWADSVEIFRGDALDRASLDARRMADVDVVYYLVHSIGTGSTFQDVGSRPPPATPPRPPPRPASGGSSTSAGSSPPARSPRPTWPPEPRSVRSSSTARSPPWSSRPA